MDKPVYLAEHFGVERFWSKNSHINRYCYHCQRQKGLKAFESLHSGFYLSILCKECLDIDKQAQTLKIKRLYVKDVNCIEYSASKAYVYRILIRYLKKRTKNNSISYSDIPNDLLDTERKMLNLKIKTNGKINKSS